VIGVYVDDMDKALDFYCNKLGFTVKHKYDDCLVHLENDGPSLILETAEKPANAKYPEMSQVALGIETKNVEETAKKLREIGADVIHDTPQKFPVGIFVAVRDPAGNLIELLQFDEE
jgi:catechol 2,3-dioxygenase-like lactoylglutathione lyase family enzyme